MGTLRRGSSQITLGRTCYMNTIPEVRWGRRREPWRQRACDRSRRWGPVSWWCNRRWFQWERTEMSDTTWTPSDTSYACTSSTRCWKTASWCKPQHCYCCCTILHQHVDVHDLIARDSIASICCRFVVQRSKFTTGLQQIEPMVFWLLNSPVLFLNESL